MLGGPLVLQKRECDLVGPLALEPLIADQMGFAAHPKTGGKPKGRLVAAIHPGRHPVQAKLLEGEVQQGVRRLSGIAVAGMGGIRDPARLPAPVLSTPEKEHDVPDHPTSLTQLHAQREGVPLGRNLPPAPTAAKPLCNHVAVHRNERDEPADFGQ